MKKKGIISWLLIISMIITQAAIPAFGSVAYASGDDPQITSLGTSTWTGNYPCHGDSVFYVEAQGLNLDDLQAEVSLYEYPNTYSPVASETNRWYLGTTYKGYDRYIYEMTVDGGGSLGNSQTYYIRLKDGNDNYYDDGTVYFSSSDPYLYIESNDMPQEVGTNISSLPFDITLDGADGSVKKENILIKLYTGTKDGYWGDITLGTLIGTAADPEIIVTGAGQYRIKGEFSISDALPAGDELYVEAEYSGIKCQTHSPIYVLSQDETGQFTMTNAIAARSSYGHHEGSSYEPADDSTYITGMPTTGSSVTSHKFTLTGEFLSSASQLSSWDDSGSNILRNGSITVSSPKYGVYTASGMIDLPKDAQEIVFKYGENTIHSVPVSHTAIQGSVSLTPLNAEYKNWNYTYPENIDNFQVALSGLNLPTSSGRYSALIDDDIYDDIDGNVIGCSVESTEGEIILNITSTDPLNNDDVAERYISILLDGTELINLEYDEYDGLQSYGSICGAPLTFGDLWYPVAFENIMPPALTRIYGSRDLDLYGEGFSTDKTYTANFMERNIGGLSAVPQELSAEFVSSGKLSVSRNQTDNLARGIYEVYIRENGEQINGFAETVLLPADDVEQIINPIVKINSDETYTLTRNVSISIDPGSFTNVRFSEFQEELGTLEYTDIQSTTNYTLSDGYGNKTIYFEFTNTEGKTYNTTASINYRSQLISAPELCGVVGIIDSELVRLFKFADYTLYVQTGEIGYTCKTDIIDSYDNVISSFTLNRTSTKDGISTYSKRINIGNEYATAAKLRFYYTDIYGLDSDYTEIPVSVLEKPYIRNCRTDISAVYSIGEYYAVCGSDVKLSMDGKSGLNGTAHLKYKDGEGSEKTLDIILAEESEKPSSYKATFTIPGDAAELLSVTYRLTDPSDSSNYAEKTESKEMKVFSSASFEGLPNNGEFDGKGLNVVSVNGISKTVAIKNGETKFLFNKLLPGNYTYWLFDSNSSFKQGNFSTQPGKAAVIDLSDTKKPASVCFNVTVENGGELSSNAYVIFNCKSGDSTYYRYARINEELKGLTDGTTIESYTLTLPTSDLKVYEIPETVTEPIVLNDGTNNINISVNKIKTITVQITVKDENVPGRTVPGTSINAGQLVTNGSTWFYYTASGITDESGNIEFEIYPGTRAYVDALKENYNFLETSLNITEDNNQNFDISMSYADQNRLVIKTMAMPLVNVNEDADMSLASESQNILTSVLIKDEDGNSLNRYFSNNTVSFVNNMYNKSVNVYPDLDNRYVSSKEYYTASLDEYGNGVIEITAIPKGVITANIASEHDGAASYMVIYDENGYNIASVNDADGRLSTETCNLDAGNYTTVLLSGYNLPNLNAFNKIDNFEGLGMKENVHYVKRNVDLYDGKITDLGEINIPEAITKDMLLPYSVTFDSIFEPLSGDGSIGKIHCKYKISISELLKNNIKLKSIGATTYSGALYNKKINGIDSEFGTLEYEPDFDGDYTVTFSADTSLEKLNSNVYMYLTFERDGKNISAGFRNKVDTPQISLIAPKHVAKTVDEIIVRGMAFNGSTVEIYDGGTLIGSTVVKSSHSYSMTASLVSPGTPSVHTLTAKMTTPDDRVFTSEPVICEIIDGDKRASISNFEFRNMAHYSSLDDPRVKPFSVEELGAGSTAACIYNPYDKSRVTFRINKLVSSQLESVYVINTDKNGVKTRYPAELVRDDPQGRYSEWIMEEVMGLSINDLSVFYSVKDGEDIGLLTGYAAPTEQQFTDALNNLESMEPANLPADYRSNEAAIITEQTENHVKAHKDFNGVRVGIEASYNNVSGYSEASLLAQGFRKIPVGNSGEFYLIKDSSTESSSEFRVYRTMYVSSGLAAAMKDGTSYARNEDVIENDGTIYASSSPILYASTANTVRNISGKVDYVGYVQNTGEVAYEAFRNRTTNLGHLGTGMQVIGGIATAAQIFSGPASVDPANLRTLTDQIKDSSVRSRLRGEITEYRKARTDSHSISSLMGVVSYGSSFFSLPGKCLSYVVSTGNMVFTQKIDAEYNLWGNGILAQIMMQLRKEDKDIGEEDDTDDPKWMMDPSGYVFEAVESNRAEGVTATVQTDSQGDWAAWEDEFLIESEQENPQTTDEYGKYGWDVPIGNWRVMFEDSFGRYNAALTKSMTVPPVHTEVNIGLVSTKAPQVHGAAADASGIEVEFSMYMQSESIYDPEGTVNGIQVVETESGETVPCEKIEFITEAENTGYTSDGLYQSDTISSKKFVKRIRFIANEELYPGGFKLYEDDGVTPKEYTVVVSENVLSYSGVKMDEDFYTNITASERMTASQPVSDTDGGNYDESITLSLSTDTPDANIYYTTDGSVPTVNSFKYTKSIKLFESSELKAIASKVGMNDSTLFSAVYMIGDDDVKIASKPVASPAGGTYTGTQNVILTTSTVNASIYYTLDGSTPGASDTLYTGAVRISSSSTLKAVAIKNGYINSSVLSETYIIKSSGGGSGSPGNGNENTDENASIIESAETEKINFKDILENDWFYENVKFVVNKGLFKGITENEFYPHSSMTRAMLVTVLFRLDGSVNVEKISFEDIQEDSWYVIAVSWASKKGVVGGYGNGMFGPNDNITREQLAAVLYRYALIKGYNTDNLSDIENFKDYENVSDWAIEPIKWMVGNKLLNGKDGNILDPSGYATRAEVAAILQRFIEYIVK